MGRGLAAIFAVTPREETEELRELPIDLIGANPRQPRRAFDEQALLSLADSIRSRGVLQPVLVRPLAGRYELIAGERRWRAAQLAPWFLVIGSLTFPKYGVPFPPLALFQVSL